MMGYPGGTAEYYGSLVAFEGPQDIVSAQLRLLPNSPKTLVLPPVDPGIEREAGPFDARAFILATHAAYKARAEVAHSFLAESTADDKRLVFLNGGTATAYMSCITAISQNETHVDIAQAGAVFEELIQNGIASLERRSRPETDTPGIPDIPELEATGVGLNGDGYAALSDPASNAMRAADALDLETASLQSLPVLELTYDVGPLRPRSTSLPDLSVLAGVHDLKRHPLPSAIRRSQFLQIEKWRSLAACDGQLTDPNSTPRSANCTTNVNPTTGYLTPVETEDPHGMGGSGHSTPAVIGTALLVDVRSSSSLNSVSSLSANRNEAGAARNRNMRLSNITLSALTGPVELCNSDAAIENTNSRNGTPLWSTSNGISANDSVVKLDRSGLRRGPPLRLSTETEGPKQSMTHVAQLSAVEGNPRAIGSANPDSPMTESAHSGSFLSLDNDLYRRGDEPSEDVLPLMEDMILYFKGEENDPRLETMVQAFRDGTYPISRQPRIRSNGHSLTALSSPPDSRVPTPNHGESEIVTEAQASFEEVHPVYHSEYDPFANRDHVYTPISTYLPKQKAVLATTQIISAPPTPAQTLLPHIADSPTVPEIHDFNVAGYKTAVSIQNSLRTLLDNHFPSEGHGYQFSFPLLPGLHGFWRPVLQENSPQHLRPARKVDLILAVGTQQGVGRDLLNSVSGALLKLGMEADGQSRSAKLDLRYLVATAMQTFTTQRLARQAHGNPFSNPEQLATLVVPHLETYLAAHSTVRFLLLEYPAEHLPTILAMQQVVGADLLKVAGVVDGSARQGSHLGYRQHDQVAPARDWTSIKGQVGVPECQSLFAKVNFALAASASQAESAKFIANIWGVLVGISAIYAPIIMQTQTSTSGSTSPPRTHSSRSMDHLVTSKSISSSSVSSSPWAQVWNQYPPLAQAAVMLGFAPSAAEIEEQQRIHEQQQKQLCQHQLQLMKQHHAPSSYVSTGTSGDVPLPVSRTSPPSNPSSLASKPRRIALSTPSRTSPSFTRTSISMSAKHQTPPASSSSSAGHSPHGPWIRSRPSTDSNTNSIISDTMAAQQNVRYRAKLQNLLGRDVIAAALGGSAPADEDYDAVLNRASYDDGASVDIPCYHIESTAHDDGSGIDDDFEEEDDDDFDCDAERRYMPLWRQQQQQVTMAKRKVLLGGRPGCAVSTTGNERGKMLHSEGSLKARKWLGLSS
ncbi:hypothetical protein F5Y17DRAFT_85695 [Xylariaceae sp. FL0594]|nr:hypothetical protein F5Y17DRAFT_85695 [Xylariaceae sp. FL0594]